MFRGFIQFVFILVLLVLFGGSFAFAQDITLSWDPNPESENVIGYKIYFQEGSSLSSQTAVGTVGGPTSVDVINNTTGTISDLVGGQTYSFAVTAYTLEQESGYSTPLTTTLAAETPTYSDSDGDGYASNVDCNDSNGSINPGASEIPGNGIDENCNGMSDDVVASDTYAAPVLGSVQTSNGDFMLQWNTSSVPDGGYDIVIDGVDTNTTHRTTQQSTTISGLSTGEHCFQIQARFTQAYPDEFLNSTEVCANSSVADPDNDGDGYTASEDCNDNNSSIHPGATEIPYNGIDENCNGADDDDDLDNDGYPASNDCNDNAAAINPGASEIPGNGIDENCNGMSDDVVASDTYAAPVLGSVQTSNGDFMLQWNTSSVPDGGYDIVIDGVDTNTTHRTTQQSTTISGLSTGEHCFQIQARFTQAYPDEFLNSTEVCANSSVADPDNDGDGYTASEDCNDNNYSIHPDAEEISGNDIDENCNGMDDDIDSSSTASTMEVGQVDIDHNWQTVTLSSDFIDPVVIVGPPTYRDAEAGLVRVRNVQSDSFEIQFAEWTYADGEHGTENVSYLVMESGIHEMSDGSVWEAGSFYLGETGVMSSENYLQGFSGAPGLLLTVQTCDEATKPVVARAANVDGYGFEAGLFTEESLLGSHGQEEVGYVAAWKSDNTGTISVNGQTLSYEMGELEVGCTFVEVDECAVKLEEEQSVDTEVTHAVEQVSTVQVGGNLFMQPISCAEMDTVALRVSEDGIPVSSGAGADTIGVRRGGSFLLTDHTPPSVAATVFSFGFTDVQSGDVVFSGDWNGDGTDTVGMRRGDTFYLRNSNSSGSADIVFTFGRATDQVIIGDWDGDGIDSVGFKRYSKFYLKNSNSSGNADMVITYGFWLTQPTDVGLAGDWDGDGTDTIGFRRDNKFYLTNTNQTSQPNYMFAFGWSSDQIVVGDWDGDGSDSIGLKRGSEYLLKNRNDSSPADTTFSFGEANDAPVAGKW